MLGFIPPFLRPFSFFAYDSKIKQMQCMRDISPDLGKSRNRGHTMYIKTVKKLLAPNSTIHSYNNNNKYTV